ncbi:MAG: hypothetical protein M1834_000657 [Cirrosporium novae-zelandiae]|nr:MAG: hypothetical protein M1834_000657 [Cirrosporium novae-zelandiae]
MEKYSQYRDKGSGIAPFFPVPTQRSGLMLPFHISLFLIRLPILITLALSYFFVLQWLPIGSLGRKAMLWLIQGTPGIWWIDLQIDGVRRGSLAKYHQTRLPQPSSIIACSYTSPIDSLYLATVFDPIFTVSYPNTRKVQRISTWKSIIRPLSYPKLEPPPKATLVDLSTLTRENPTRAIAVFPECTTTNGRGILAFSPSLLSASPTCKIFPVSIRYTSPDITTPVPRTYFTFLWNLLSKSTHCIRVRIAEPVYNSTRSMSYKPPSATTSTDILQDDTASESTLATEDDEGLTSDERKTLDKVAEALARLGRVKRVGLGVKEKLGFVELWTRSKRR